MLLSDFNLRGADLSGLTIGKCGPVESTGITGLSQKVYYVCSVDTKLPRAAGQPGHLYSCCPFLLQSILDDLELLLHGSHDEKNVSSADENVYDVAMEWLTLVLVVYYEVRHPLLRLLTISRLTDTQVSSSGC